jgi:hypothetical protein
MLCGAEPKQVSAPTNGCKILHKILHPTKEEYPVHILSNIDTAVGTFLQTFLKQTLSDELTGNFNFGWNPFQSGVYLYQSPQVVEACPAQFNSKRSNTWYTKRRHCAPSQGWTDVFQACPSAGTLKRNTEKDTFWVTVHPCEHAYIETDTLAG